MWYDHKANQIKNRKRTVKQIDGKEILYAAPKVLYYRGGVDGEMSPKKDFVDMIHAHIKLERNTEREIKRLENTATNLAAKLFLAEMRFDTEKHAKILQTMLDVIRQKNTEIASKKLWNTRIHSYVDALVAKKMLEDHLKVETKMLKHVEDEVKGTKDDALKLLLKHIAEDEKKHHEIMETILKKSFKMGP